MKPLHLILPGIAVIVAASGLGYQQRSIVVLDREGDLLEKHIAEARLEATAEKSPASSAALAAKAKDKIDWKELAGKLGDLRGDGIPDMRAMLKLQRQVMAMDPVQLADALDEIAALDLPAKVRSQLEDLLLQPLIEKSPELALSRFMGRLNDEEGAPRSQLSNALQQWVKKDPAAAIAWFDREISKGTFESKSLDGNSRNRTQFEGAVIFAVMSNDPDAAARRLAALPENLRLDTLKKGPLWSVAKEDQAAYAKLVRGQLPEKEQAKVIAQVIRFMPGSDDYSNVTEYMDRIGATPTERAACVDSAVVANFQGWRHREGITVADVDKLREWAGKQAPGQIDAATGKAIAGPASSGAEGSKFSDLVDLANHYHDAGGGDAVIVPLLQTGEARNNKDLARELAAKVADEKTRGEILRNLNLESRH